MKKQTPKADHFLIRQGDVLVERVDAIPTGAVEIPRDNERVILAYGEVTGHAHAIRDAGVCFLRSEGTTDRFLSVPEFALLQHEEHGEISIPAGTFRVRIQREYSPEEIRNVAD